MNENGQSLLLVYPGFSRKPTRTSVLSDILHLGIYSQSPHVLQWKPGISIPFFKNRIHSPEFVGLCPIRNEFEGPLQAEGDLRRSGQHEIWEDAHGPRQSGPHKKCGRDATGAKIPDRSGVV